MKRLRPPARTWAAFFVMTAIVAGLSGCSSVGKDGGMDMAYVSVPDPEAEKKPVLTAGDLRRLFPSAMGRRWTMKVTLAPADPAEQTPANTQHSQDTAIVEKREDVKDGVRVRHAFRFGNTVHRRETYLVTKGGIYLVESGGNGDTVRLSPPMPLVKVGVPAGKRYIWEGKITIGGQTAPARAYGRIFEKREVQVGGQRRDAYRVDTVLSFPTRQRQEYLPSTRYFAPDVGVVRQTSILFDKDKPVRLDKELIEYE